MIAVKRTILVLVYAGQVASGAELAVVGIQDARQALREGIPQVAIEKLRAVLALPGIVSSERHSAALLLAEAYISAGKPESVPDVLVGSGSPAEQVNLLLGDAAAAAGRWDEAAELYSKVNSDGPHAVAAAVRKAESLWELGQISDAIRVLETVATGAAVSNEILLRLACLHSEVRQVEQARRLLGRLKNPSTVDGKWHRYIEGRLTLADTTSLPNADTARQIFEELLRERERVPEDVLFGATLGLSEAQIRLGGYDAGSEVLENFIRRYPQSRYLERAFKRLDRIYSEQEDPDDGELQKWSQRMPTRRAALATFYAAKVTLRERRLDRTEKLLKRFFETFSNHPLTCEAHLMEADVHLMRGNSKAAVTALESSMRDAIGIEQRAEIELRTAIVHHSQGEYLLAANLFRSAAERSARLKPVATFNAALSWLGQRNFDAFAKELRALEEMPDTQPMRAELLLEQGLTQARHEDFLAEETLQLFLRRHPRHARSGEARLALAELEFRVLQASANPARRAEAAEHASRYLRVANNESTTHKTSDHADYLAVFLADQDGGGNDREVIRRGEEFLRLHKGSQLIPDIRMKLGEVYFRVEDFANAETQFGTLAEENPTSPYAEKALFLAGQSAMRLGMNENALDRALGYFDRVVKRDGQLKLYARQEQAIAQSRVGRANEAIALYDIILSAEPAADPELRFAALCGKADNLVALGRKERTDLEEAVTVFDKLAASANVTPVWRNQALYKKGKTLVQLGRISEALAAYYDVLQKSSSSEREHFWSSKAGFDAASILEQQEQWKAAIGIYSKVVALDGPRAAEAEARVKQIRLEHFVWD